MRDFTSQRERMVKRQLSGRGIGDERVLAAMRAVPRELFVPEPERRRAYVDGALPIGAGQTISQPWIVAAICEALELRGGERVLEIGTGSGYSTAILASLAGEVISVERHGNLASGAREALGLVGAANVEVLTGDGSRGLPQRAPFDAIAVHAAAPAPPRELLEQLRPGGLLVAPVAEAGREVLRAFRATPSGIESRTICDCRFVPLLGAAGYAA